MTSKVFFDIVSLILFFVWKFTPWNEWFFLTIPDLSHICPPHLHNINIIHNCIQTKNIHTTKSGNRRRRGRTHHLRIVRRDRSQDGRKLPCSLHWREGNGQERKAPSLQGIDFPPCHSQFHASRRWFHRWKRQGRRKVSSLLIPYVFKMCINEIITRRRIPLI